MLDLEFWMTWIVWFGQTQSWRQEPMAMLDEPGGGWIWMDADVGRWYSRV